MEQNSTTGSRNIMPFKMAGSEKMRIDTLGNVGIGTSAPSYLLDVYGGSGRISTPSNDGTLYLGTSTVQYKNSTNTICLGAASINTAAATGTNNLAIGNASMGSVSSGSNNTACGNTALTGTTLGSNNTGVGFSAGSGITSGTGNVYVGAASVASSGGANNEIVIGAGAVGIGNNSVVLGNDNIVTTSLNGNVGIKTKLPAAVLDVNGAVKFRGALDMTNQNISGVGSLTAGAGITAGGNLTVSGNVGIGTLTPSNKLHINGTLQVDAGDIKLAWGTPGINRKLAVELSDTYRNGLLFKESRELQLFSCGESVDGGRITFFTRAATAANSSDYGTERMRITESGNVGIGTSTPGTGYKLDVAGDILKSGSYGGVCMYNSINAYECSVLLHPLGCIPCKCSSSGVVTSVGTFFEMPVSGYATDNYACYFYPAARYDMYRYIVNLTAGNYKFRIIYGYAGDRGQMSLYVDNTYITWFEGYGTGNTNAKSTSSDFNIPNTGTHKVELRIDDKHPSSTNYYFLFQCASIFKTS